MESESTKSCRTKVENEVDKVEEKNFWIMQELNNIKNIVFDLGGVLIDLEPERTLKAFADLKKYSQTKDTNSLATKEEEKSPISINDLVGGGESEWMQKYQIGKMTTEELALRAGFMHLRCCFTCFALVSRFHAPECCFTLCGC